MRIDGVWAARCLGLLAGLSLAQAADFSHQPPVRRLISEVSPGVWSTPDPDVFVIRNGALPPGVDAPPTCPEQSLKYWTGTPIAVCNCFAVGEQAGVVFAPPASHYPLDVLAVNIAWGSGDGFCDQSQPDLQGAINFYRGGLPNPGLAPGLELEAPGLFCGAINGFNLQQLGLQPFRVNSGAFTITLEFDPATAPPTLGRSIVSDGNGCTPGRNAVFALPFFAWFDACNLGISGDFCFETVYRRVTCACPGDTNGDHAVDFFDLNTVLGQFGGAGQGLNGDVNADGFVNFFDLNVVLTAYGVAC